MAAKTPRLRLAVSLLACATMIAGSPADAQDEGQEEGRNEASPSDDAPGTDAADDAQAGRGQVYQPDYFSQYAPRNALDMVRQIPGFSISGGDDDQRGLGQADQNVLVNGDRLSSKSDSTRDQLSRIPAGDVVRIEIVDGTTLDLPGLTGQVANVIVESTGASGQFRWEGGFRPHNTSAELFGGEISLTGSYGALDYTVAFSNENNRFGADGPTSITDGMGNLLETQESKFSGRFDNPELSVNFSYDISSDTVANLNMSFRRNRFFARDPEIGIPVSGPVRTRFSERGNKRPSHEISGDIEFPFGPGRLKLIALDSYAEREFESTVIDSFDDGSFDSGSRFGQVNGSGERIGRFEYGWKMLSADWQLSGEAAFNRLDRVSELFELDTGGNFVELDFPEGTGGVKEDRFESILSFSKQLTPALALQATAGAEYSKIEQTGAAANSRSFQRPKGSVSLAWKLSSDFDMSVELARRVGQLSFGDFLASVSLNDDNQNAGNNELVPEQSWVLEAEINKSLGPWGSIKLELEQSWISDFIDFIPLPDGGESRGNIPSANSTGLEFTGTFKFDPVGIPGAQLDLRIEREISSLLDPLSGETRAFSHNRDFEFGADFRHDIPQSDWAYGVGTFHFHRQPYFRQGEIGRDYEGPVFLDIFVEHKDVLGLTLNASAGNLLGARNRFERTVYDGSRIEDPILFVENRNRRIGPIFRFSVSGNF